MDGSFSKVNLSQASWNDARSVSLKNDCSSFSFAVCAATNFNFNAAITGTLHYAAVVDRDDWVDQVAAERSKPR